jgi:hypothetical protein
MLECWIQQSDVVLAALEHEDCSRTLDERTIGAVHSLHAGQPVSLYQFEFNALLQFPSPSTSKTTRHLPRWINRQLEVLANLTVKGLCCSVCVCLCACLPSLHVGATLVLECNHHSFVHTQSGIKVRIT